MQPLKPQDLLLRQTPVEHDRWSEGKSTEDQPVALERFQTLEHVIRDTPVHIEPYLELAKIYLQGGRWNDAKRVLDLAVARFPEHEEANYLREESQLARSLQLHSEAERAHREEPTVMTKDSLERCRIQLNVLREKVCKARLERDPQKSELLLPLATALNNLGQVDEAVEALHQAVQQPPLRAVAALQLGQVMEAAGRIPEALSAYRKAAMFRVPPPSREVRLAALNAAADLAERSNLIDSAQRYVSILLDLNANDSHLQQRYKRLSESPL